MIARPPRHATALGASTRSLTPRIPLRVAHFLFCLLASTGTAAAQPPPARTYTSQSSFLAEVLPYETLEFTVITSDNLTAKPIEDPYTPGMLHYPEMTFGPVIVETPSTNQYVFGFHTFDNYWAVWGDSIQSLRDELIDGNALIPGWGNEKYEQGLRFRFSEAFTRPVTAFGAYFGSTGEISACCVRQLLRIEFWDGSIEQVDVVAVRGIEQANEQFMGYSSPGRPIRSVTFYQNGHSMLLDNFVYGYGYARDRVIRLSGDLSFGGVGVGASGYRVLRIHNDGTEHLAVTGIAYPTGFNGGWAGVIEPGTYQDVLVTFAPQAGGVYGGPVVVHGNQTSGIGTMPSFGLGTVAESRVIALSGDLTFGTVPVGLTSQRTLRISNIGSAPLTVAGIKYPTGFSGAWSGVIATGSSVDVVVTFAPSSMVFFGGSVTVDGDQTSGSNTRATSGAGIFGPVSVSGDLAFGAVLVGNTETRTIRLTNAGVLPVFADFSYPWSPAFSGRERLYLAPGAAADLTVTFRPLQMSNVGDFPLRDYGGFSLVIRYDGGGETRIPVSGTGVYPGTRLIDVTGDLSFGTILVGTAATGTLRIANKGSETVTVTGIDYPTGFTGAWSGDIPQGGVREVTVTFAPTSATTYFGHVRVRGNQENSLSIPWETAFGGRRWNDFTQALGEGSSEPTRVIALSGDLAFGAVSVGTTATRTLRIRNLGTTTLTITGLTYPSGFSGPWSGSIPAGGVRDVLVTFAPTAGISYSGTITVAGNPTRGSNVIAVEGIGAARQLELSGDLAFGGVLVGTTATRTIRIRNTGNAALEVSSLSTPLPWSVADWSGTVAAGGFRDVSVSFTPTAVTAMLRATLTVSANQTGGTPTAALSGWGTAACRPITLEALGFTTWRVGVAYPDTFSSESGGYQPVTFAVTGGALPEGLSLTTRTFSAFTISGTPTRAGTFSFTVTATDVIGCTGFRTYVITITDGSTAFAKTAPINGATNEATPTTLAWQSSTGATSYAYCVDTVNNGSCDTSWISTGAATSVSVNGLGTGQTYYWQVQANASGGTTYANGSASAYWSFTTAAGGGGSPTLPPSGLYVASVTGNTVTVRWTPPASGSPTGYRLEGGVSPGQTLITFATGSTYPIYTFTSATGSFLVRMRALYGTIVSDASNEVPLHVNVPVAPSAPVDLLRMVQGSTVALSWRNTFAGGAPSSMVLDVTGSFNGSVPLGQGETISFSGVPAGAYTVSLRAINAAGSSAASTPVMLTVPSATCTEAPQMPVRFLAYRSGSTISVIWEPAATGGAPTSYTVEVTGSYAGTVSTPARSASGTVGRGSYGLRVAATNSCGSSTFTPIQTLTVP